MAINYSNLMRHGSANERHSTYDKSETKTTKAYLNQNVQRSIKWRCLKGAGTKWRMNTKDPP